MSDGIRYLGRGLDAGHAENSDIRRQATEETGSGRAENPQKSVTDFKSKARGGAYKREFHSDSGPRRVNIAVCGVHPRPLLFHFPKCRETDQPASLPLENED